MKKRLISAAAGLLVLAFALCFYNTFVLNLLLCLIGALAVWELLNADGLSHHIPLMAACTGTCAVVLFGGAAIMEKLFAVIAYACVLCVLIYGLVKHKQVSFKDCFYALFSTLVIAVAFNMVVLVRDRAGAQIGVFYLFIMLGSAWWSDTGAYFVGTFFGRHKLCPEISPKKTWEGLIGGVVCAIALNIAVCYAFQAVSAAISPFGYFTGAVRVDIPLVALFSLPLSLLGVLGDLVASMVKRQCGVKDFGTIMPGHGGVMDRFDSVLTIIPAVYIIFVICPLISAA